ncbi:MAG TPA: two-component system response regulator OmpR [Methylophilaceae bacterium]
MNKRILVVDDDVRLRDLLVRYLSEQGYAVLVAANGADMDKLLLRERVDLMVLDWMLPNESGLEICQRLRSAGENLPIIMLTAKGDDVDRIVGLETGADDYLPKPFNPRELMARINAVLRRHAVEITPGAPSLEVEKVQFAEFTLELDTRRLFKGDELLPLTSAEFSLLHVLVKHPRQPMSRDKLMELTRGREFEVFDRSVDVQISRLRKMLEPDLSKPRYIQTVWGIGYVFVPEGTPS